MDAELIKALDAMCDDLGSPRLAEVLESPEKHTYTPTVAEQAAGVSDRGLDW